jgi:hypothetical protein
MREPGGRRRWSTPEFLAEAGWNPARLVFAPPAGHRLLGRAVAGDCPAAAAADARGLDGALPAEDRLLDVGAAVLEPTVGVDDGVGLRVRVCVTVAVWVVAPELEAREVTVVGSVVVRVSGEVFPPRIVSPEPPDSGVPLTLSTSVTVAMLPAKITTAAAAPASTAVSGRRDRLGAGAAGGPALGMTTVGSSSGPGTLGRDGRRPAATGVAGAAGVAPAGVAGVASPGRTSRSALVTRRRVTSRE